MLRLWGRLSSINVRKVVWAVQELGLPSVQRTDAGGQYGIVREARYLGLNPNGLVPLIEDEDTGVTLWESNAIVRYLASRHGAGTLCPADPQARAVADQWMDWASTTVGPAMDRLRSAYRKPAAEQDREAVAAALAAAGRVWSIADAAIGRAGGYLAGDRLTMADIALGPLLHRWHLVPLDRPALPHVDGLYRGLCGRDGYLRHVVQVVA